MSAMRVRISPARPLRERSRPRSMSCSFATSLRKTLMSSLRPAKTSTLSIRRVNPALRLFKNLFTASGPPSAAADGRAKALAIIDSCASVRLRTV